MVDEDGGVRIRRIRAWEMPRLAFLGARTIEAHARTAKLKRVRAAYPPPPLRLATLTVVRLFNLALLPSWVARTGSDAATVTAYPLAGTGRVRGRLAMIGRLLALFGGVLAAVVVIMTRWPAAALPILVVGVLGFVAVYAPLLWPAVYAWRDREANRALRQARAAVVAATPGPVLWACDLAGGGHGAARALARRLVAAADAEGITIVAFIEEGLVRYYRRQGFRCGPSVPTSWGSQRLPVRPPASPAPPGDLGALLLPGSRRRPRG